MSFYYDKQVRSYCFFLLFFAFLVLGAGLIFHANQVNGMKAMFLSHDKALASSLLEQGVSKQVIAIALTNVDTSETGEALLEMLGIGEQTEHKALPFLFRFWRNSLCGLLLIAVFLIFILFAGTFHFFGQRIGLYLQADKIIRNYLGGDYSYHLPQNKEGLIFQLFSSVEQLATMLQSKNETEHKAKEFLKSTISDISHQLKTPLAALALYQEIIEKEADNMETVKEFSSKVGTALNRMEQLIGSMLKITRLDTGSIVFHKSYYPVTELIAHSISELTTRAEAEEKEILLEGDCGQLLACDMEWTSEAIGNVVKNALDHTNSGGLVHIRWEQTATMFRIFISDNGNGIAQEDIHHIFKRFYRSKHSLDTQGIGLGLPLAKAIVEEQGGMISVQSELNEGTTFTLSFFEEL